MCFSKDLFFTFRLNRIQGKTSTFCNRSLNIQLKLLRWFLGILFLSLPHAPPWILSHLCFTIILSHSTFVVHKSICIEPHNGRTVTWMSYCSCPGSIALYLAFSTTAAWTQIEMHVLRCSFIILQLSLTVTEWGLVSHSVITLSVIIWFCYCKSQRFSACTIEMC